jgi:hypothetical protein
MARSEIANSAKPLKTKNPQKQRNENEVNPLKTKDRAKSLIRAPQ